MKDKLKRAFMQCAWTFADLSSAERRKVGCVLVDPTPKREHIISIGYNGTPPGWNNVCEEPHPENPNLTISKEAVLHAEENALGKLTGGRGGAFGAWAFVTAQPCIRCARMMYLSGIIRLIYDEPYRLTEGIDFLRAIPIEPIEVEQIRVRSGA